MAPDPVLATVHYRAELAGQALEAAVTTLRSTRMFRGIVEIRQAVAHLQAAQQALAASGRYPALAEYFGALVTFYQGEARKAFRPASAAAVAAEIAVSQANVLAGDPVLTPGVAR